MQVAMEDLSLHPQSWGERARLRPGHRYQENPGIRGVQEQRYETWGTKTTTAKPLGLETVGFPAVCPPKRGFAGLISRVCCIRSSALHLFPAKRGESRVANHPHHSKENPKLGFGSGASFFSVGSGKSTHVSEKCRFWPRVKGDDCASAAVPFPSRTSHKDFARAPGAARALWGVVLPLR